MALNKRELHNWYLAALGVPRYVPRDQCDEEAPAIENDAGQEVPVTAVVDTQAPGEPLEQISRILKPEAAQKIIEASEAPDAPDASNTEPSKPELDKRAAEDIAAARLNLVAWQPADDLLVINDLGEGGQVSADHGRLLINILRAVQRLPENGVLPHSEPLVWPDKSGDSSEAGARIMMSSFLTARIAKRHVRVVLFMGEDAARFVAEKSNDADAPGESVSLSGEATGIVIPTLDQMLADPEAKKTTWQAIRHLAGTG